MKRKYVVIQTVVQNDPEAVTKTICNPVSFPLLNQAYAGVKNPLQVYQVNLTFSQKVKIIHQLQVSEEFKLELLNHADIFMSMDALSFNQFENLGIFNKDGISLWTYLQKIKNEAILEGKETAIKATIKTPEWLKGVEGAEEMVEALGGMSKLCNIMADIKNNAPSINTIPTINFREQTKQVLDQMIKASVKPVHVPIWLKQQPIYRDIVSGNILTKDGYGKIPVNPIPKRHVSVSLPYGGRNPYLHDIVLGDIENMVIRNGIGKVVKQFGLIQEMEAKPSHAGIVVDLDQVYVVNPNCVIRDKHTNEVIEALRNKTLYTLKKDMRHITYPKLDGVLDSLKINVDRYNADKECSYEYVVTEQIVRTMMQSLTGGLINVKQFFTKINKPVYVMVDDLQCFYDVKTDLSIELQTINNRNKTDIIKTINDVETISDTGLYAETKQLQTELSKMPLAQKWSDEVIEFIPMITESSAKSKHCPYNIKKLFNIETGEKEMIYKGPQFLTEEEIDALSDVAEQQDEKNTKAAIKQGIVNNFAKDIKSDRPIAILGKNQFSFTDPRAEEDPEFMRSKLQDKTFYVYDIKIIGDYKFSRVKELVANVYDITDIGNVEVIVCTKAYYKEYVLKEVLANVKPYKIKGNGVLTAWFKLSEEKVTPTYKEVLKQFVKDLNNDKPILLATCRDFGYLEESKDENWHSYAEATFKEYETMVILYKNKEPELFNFISNSIDECFDVDESINFEVIAVTECFFGKNKDSGGYVLKSKDILNEWYNIDNGLPEGEWKEVDVETDSKYKVFSNVTTNSTEQTIKDTTVFMKNKSIKPVTVTDILKLLQDRKCIVDIYNIDSAIRVTEDDIIKYVIDKVNYGLDDLINKDDLYHMFYKGVDGNRTIDDIRTKLSDDYRYIPAVFNDDVRIMVISRNLINKLGLNYLGFDTKGKDLLHAIDNPIVKSKSYPVITVLDTDTALNFKYKCESDRETGLKKINKGIELFHMPDTDNTKEQVEDYNSICKLAAIHFGLKVSDDNIYYVSEAFIKEYLKDNNGTLHRVIPLNIEGLENVLPQHHILFTMHNVKVIKDLNNIKTIVGSTESLYCVVPGEIKNQEAFDHFINYFITRLVESDKNSTSTPNGDYKFIITKDALDQYFRESPYSGFEFSNLVRVNVNDKGEIEEC